MAAAGSHLTRDMALKAGGVRVAIDTPMVDGSILLKGAKFDDLRLKQYRETTDKKSPEIVLLAPKSTDYPYYAAFGWIGQGVKVPDDQSEWKQTGGATLAPGKPVSLSWDNGHGLVFTRTIAIDDKYMFTVADSVANNSSAAVSLYPYAYVAREGVPKANTSFALHLGFVGVANGSEVDGKYDDFKEEGTPPKAFTSTGGWLGITDKYWMAAVVPPQNEAFNGEYLGATLGADTKAYQANYRLGARVVAPGGTASVSHRLFAGAKVVDILRDYQNKQGVARFDLAVDWGWFWFLTRPFFWLLDNLYKLLGNFGLAILVLTVIVKLAFFPIANAQFKSMSKMKKVQPEMERLKKAHADDPQKQQQAIMEMYKREKVNPLAGCFPILLTIPVFFSLYKVLYVTIEMRQAPFYGWIRDLSAPDPTSILNLFGLLPYHIPMPCCPPYLPVHRDLADHLWRDPMGADQDESHARRSGAGAHVRLHAGDLHLHVRHLPSRPGDLLRLEQSSVGGAAICDHAARGREGASVREHLKLRKGRRGRMTADDEIEAARKLFAGPCDFVWGAQRADNLPPEDLPEIAFVGRSNAGKSSLINAADRAQDAGAGIADAGCNTADQFLQAGRPADAGRSARLWLRQKVQGRGRQLAGVDLRLSAGAGAPQAGGAVDRRAARGDGQRRTGDDAARPGGGLVWTGADQNRRSGRQGSRPGAASGR